MPRALIIILNTEEDLTLKELSCADKVPRLTKQRAIALRLNAHGWNVPQIAQYLGWAQQTVRCKRDELAGRVFEDEYELAIAVIEGIENRALQGQYQVKRFMFN